MVTECMETSENHPPTEPLGISGGSFEAWSVALRDAVDAALERSMDADGHGDDWPFGLRRAMKHSLLAPGKRIRPILVLLACEAAGGHYQQAMPAACAVEMIHAYSLIHDDLPAMDDDDLRRGLPTCHAAFGEANAILAGDALQALAFQSLARDISPAEVAAACVRELAFAAGPAALVGGQFDDLAAEAAAGSLEQLEHIHRRKTGALLRACLKIGGLTARATEEQLAALDRYGDKIGLAFQVVDDLLDECSTEQQMGKKVGKDRDRGKLTYPRLIGVAKSTELAQKLVSDACEAVEIFGSNGSKLRQLAHYLAERTH